MPVSLLDALRILSFIFRDPYQIWMVIMLITPSSQIRKRRFRNCESRSVMLTLCDSMDYTVLGIPQAKILEWVAFPFSRESSSTQGWNTGLPHCRQILYQLSHKGSPRSLGHCLCRAAIYFVSKVHIVSSYSLFLCILILTAWSERAKRFLVS